MTDEEFFELLFWENVKSLYRQHTGVELSEKTPKIGPFWYLEDNGSFEIRDYLDFTVPLPLSDKYDEERRGVKKDHAQLWQKVQKEHPEFSALKFYEVPRGRIIMKGYEFIIFLSKTYAGNQKLLSLIYSWFNIPESLSRVMISPEYRDK